MNLDFTYNILAVPVLITSFLFLLLGVFTFRKRAGNGEIFFAGLLAGCFIYSLFYGLELLANNEFTVVLTYKLQYLGGVLITPFLLLFVLKYSGNERYLKSFLIYLIFVLSGLFLVALFTNDSHRLFYKILTAKYNGFYLAVSFEKGILDVAYESFNNIIILISTLVLVKMYYSIPKPYKSQVLTLLAGTTFPWLAHSLALFGYSYRNIDFVPFTLLISAVFIYIGLFRLGLFRKTPIAFKTIFENLSDGILIFDRYKNIIAANKKAVKILRKNFYHLQNTNIKDLYLDHPEIQKLFSTDKAIEVEFMDVENDLFYSGFLKNTEEEDFQYLFLRDISKQKLAEEKIRFNESKLQNINTSLLRNEKMLTSIAFATKELLSNANFSKATQKAITILGDGASADRAYLFENNIDEAGNYFSSQRFEWSATGVDPEIDNPDLQNLPIGLFGESMDYLIKNQVYTNIVRKIEDPDLRGLLESQDIISILLIPIFVEKSFWGFVGFDDCQKEKQWSEGETALLISFAESISNAIERRNMEENLRVSMQNAKEASIAKSEFLANMSHEIRTPLNGIIGFSDLLMKTDLGQTQKEFLKSIVDSGHLLLDLVNDVLDFSKIEAGKLELSPTQVNLTKLANDAVKMIKPMAEEKGIELLVSLPDDMPSYFYADETRLKQILINLLSNAGKFTQKGKIELLVKIDDLSNKDHAHLEFMVIDTGIGISNEKKDIIFDAFAQEDNSTTRKYGGTGLGLSISNKILQLMGSKLEVETEVGKGSIFSFKIILPIMNGQENLQSNEEPKQISQPKTLTKTVKKGKIKILLVDDNPVNMLLAKTIVKNILPSSKIFEAKNGREALDSYREHIPDLIFMDIQMPEMSGYEATIAIRKIEAGNSRVPIIALTAGTVKGEYDRCISAGMDDYLSKPVVVADIQNKIEKFISLSKDPEIQTPLFSKLEEFRNSDPNFFKELLEVSNMNLTKLKEDLISITNNIKNTGKIKQTCHAIKGVALNLDLSRLSKYATTAEEIEKMNDTERQELLSGIHLELDNIIDTLKKEIAKI
ncbi:histidine kinase N-terminal 7TM domain-containing protein [Mongoliibacter ruber]|uniref:Sensory/regulatory protein RpfC n=1 Tax=Mongoliibacter ruber TaxID=1750599 RepID=A0A2T0WCG8_9BACT|nr:histidine kinase N-terminal 7TM domain-containing protein [Mongoliibacter ruber]PRY84401.1 signal transduction histidine kinase [Mongoliibacter ruber]